MLWSRPLYHGKSHVWCHSRIVSTADARMPHIVMLLIAIPMGVFAALVAYPVGPGAVAVTGVLYTMMYLVAVLGANTDPGIVPPHNGTALCDGEATGVGEEPRMCRGIALYPKDIVEGVGMAGDNMYIRRYCHTCHVVRPVRASHCPECDYCVHEFDHHCGVLGICVGERTWRYFTWFVYIAFIACLYTLSVCAYVLMGYGPESEKYPLMHVASILLVFVVALLALCAGNFAVTYGIMTYKGTTTRDDDLHHHDTYWDRSKGFPFDEGCLKNCWRRMFCPKYPSVVLLHRERGEVV